ncbi:MAG: helix-turn-helix transcriptional regulator [Chloroflexi bacterium]|nr:helix-turn-helix transcriptional regulator [Chloroflexota bacterium]
MIKLLSDALAAIDADDDVRIPHAVALAIINGKSPILAYRNHLGLTLQGLSAKTGLAVSYLSEIERGRKAGSTAAMKAIAAALGTTADVLLID